MIDERIKVFHDNVALKYSLYNSLFLTLPFQKMQETGTLLSLFGKYCQKEIVKGKTPQTIVEHFLKKNLDKYDQSQCISLLFTMLHFVERQIVLFDALEDAAFEVTHQINGPGSLNALLNKITHQHQENFLKKIAAYQIKIVLTAHPTQFYPPPVLGIITQLSQAIQNNNLKQITDLLWQMGKTSFKYQKKPTPYQEALSLVWYLENNFYPTIANIQQTIEQAVHHIDSSFTLNRPVVSLGFWPGGDRDGNPNITDQTTIEVAQLLKTRILKLYVQDIRQLAKKLTFKGILENLQWIRHKLEETFLYSQLEKVKERSNDVYHNANELLDDLASIKNKLIQEHDGLFLESLENFIIKVRCFGFYFASMDMRENAPIHAEVLTCILQNISPKTQGLPKDHKNYHQLTKEKKLGVLSGIINNKVIYHQLPDTQNSIIINTINSHRVIKKIQQNNGELGLCRYIISHTQTALDVLELFTLLRMVGNFDQTIPVDVLPLFESITDLENSAQIIAELYHCPWYRAHLAERNNTQMIMLGFSDGTKDGGYVTANWSIYKAKLQLTEISKNYDIKVVFFDGRGGPPARGGGNMHDFYRSLGSKISHEELQLTVQGQTISSKFGTYASAKNNIEQLLTAGLDDLIFPQHSNDLSEEDYQLIEQLSQESGRAYHTLKEDPLFVPYLEEMTPLNFFSELNIGSRPASRKKSKKLALDDLRAIPFVGAWSQLKQNIPGYFGFGTALKKLGQQGLEKSLTSLYRHSLFFRTLVENAMMGLCKTFFPLTAYMKTDRKFGKFWQQLYSEAQTSELMLKKVARSQELLEKDPTNRESIHLREEIVLPLLVIQQYAMNELKKLDPKKDAELYSIYKEMILKSLAANTNASRNSA